MAETQPVWEQALCYTATDYRVALQNQVLGEGVAAPGGVPYVGDLAVTTGASGLNLFVAQGGGFVSADAADEGMYSVYNDDTVTLTATGAAAVAGTIEDGVPNANGSNPRVDQVIALVRDSQISGLDNDWQLAVLTGTAHASAALTPAGIAASAFALPDRAIRLAYVLVPTSFAGPFVDATHILDARTSAHHPMIRVYRAGAFNVTAAIADIVFDTLDYDTFGGGTIGAAGTLFNTTTGIFAAPSVGLYRVTGSVGHSTAAVTDYQGLNFQLNSVDVASTTTGSGVSGIGHYNSYSTLMRVTTAGHPIKARQFAQTTRTGLVGTAATWMTIEKIAG